MDDGAGLLIALIVLTTVLILATVWWRTKAQGRDEFWKGIERLGWVCAVLSTVATLVVLTVNVQSDDPKSAADQASTPQTPDPETTTPSSTPVTTPTPSTATSTPPTSSEPASPYKLQPALPSLRIAAPRSSCGRTFADLDVPAVRVNKGDEPGDDLMYWSCSPIGLQLQNGQYFGAAAKTRPATAEACAQLARIGAVSGSIEPSDLKLDQAFCLVTDEENVAWLKLIKKEKSSTESDPDLVFQFAVWKRST